MSRLSTASALIVNGARSLWSHVLLVAETYPTSRYNTAPGYGNGYGGWGGWWWWIVAIVAFLILIAIIGGANRGARRWRGRRTGALGTPTAVDGTGTDTAGNGAWAWGVVVFIIIIGFFIAGWFWWGTGANGPGNNVATVPNGYGQRYGLPNGPGYGANAAHPGAGTGAAARPDTGITNGTAAKNSSFGSNTATKGNNSGTAGNNAKGTGANTTNRYD